jgi:hypothetical protein
MGKRKRTAAVAAVLLPLLGATAAAIAQTNGEPKIESVEASIVWTHISGAFRVCENSAGVEFVEEKNLVLTGVSTGHPRLSGWRLRERRGSSTSSRPTLAGIRAR